MLPAEAMTRVLGCVGQAELLRDGDPNSTKHVAADGSVGIPRFGWAAEQRCIWIQVRDGFLKLKFNFMLCGLVMRITIFTLSM